MAAGRINGWRMAALAFFFFYKEMYGCNRGDRIIEEAVRLGSTVLMSSLLQKYSLLQYNFIVFNFLLT